MVGFNNMKIILSKNKELLPEIMQKLYNNIIIYFINRNYFNEKSSNENKEGDLEFTINIINERRYNKENQLSNAKNQISEKLNQFETFTELIKNIFFAIKKFENLIDLNEIQSNLLSIIYKIDYGGVFKDAENNAILAIAYSVYQYYKILKENTFFEENDESYNYYLDSLKSYIQVSNLFKNNFSVIENFKFYDEQDLKAVTMEESNKENKSGTNLTKSDNESGIYFY